MFVWNTEKGLKYFKDFYVTSDHLRSLIAAKKMGAHTIIRLDKHLLTCPNIEWYKHCYKYMGSPDIIVALQVNSPTLKESVIEEVLYLMNFCQEVKTCHVDGSDYGSVWAMTKERLFNYPDPYNAKPDQWVVDPSTDIHTLEDLKNAI